MCLNHHQCNCNHQHHHSTTTSTTITIINNSNIPTTIMIGITTLTIIPITTIGIIRLFPVRPPMHNTHTSPVCSISGQSALQTNCSLPMQSSCTGPPPKPFHGKANPCNKQCCCKHARQNLAWKPWQVLPHQ